MRRDHLMNLIKIKRVPFAKMIPWIVLALSVGIGLYVGGLGLFSERFSRHKPVRELKIAIVDGARIKQECEPFLRVAEAEKRELDKIYQAMQGKHKEVRRLLTLSKDSKVPIKKRAEYKKQSEAIALQYENEVQKRKDFLRVQFTYLNRTLENAVLQTTSELAKKYKLYIIFNTNVFDTMTIFYAAPEIDLTNEAIRVINQRMRHLRFQEYKESGA